MNAETYKDLAAAYKDDIQGLKERKSDVYLKFESVTGRFQDYFTTKNNEARENLIEEKRKRYKAEICDNVVDEYLTDIRVDKDRVESGKLDIVNKPMGFLSRSAYNTYIKAVHEHESAIRSVEKGNPSNFGNANNIDKDLYKRNLLFSDEVENAGLNNDGNAGPNNDGNAGPNNEGDAGPNVGANNNNNNNVRATIVM